LKVNQIRDKGANELNEVLIINSTLDFIHIGGNEIGEDVKKNMKKTFENRVTIK
jgi:hypothetical protein